MLINSPAVIFYKQLGDVLLLEPALAKLAAAYQRKVILHTRNDFAPLVELMENVKIAGFPAMEKVSKLISFNPTQRAALTALLMNAESKVAVFKSPSIIRWWHHLAYTDGCLWHADSLIYRPRYFFDATPCEAVQPYRPPQLLPPPEDWFPSNIPSRYVLLHGTSAWKRKSWPAEKWAKVLDQLHDAGIGPFVCTSGSAYWELNFIQELERSTQASILNLAGQTDLKAYLALVAKAKMVLCIDGSVTHIAAAFRRPCVTLFGPTNPVHWHSPSEHTELVSARQFTNEAPYSMSDIPIDAVVKSALNLWAQESPSRQAELTDDKNLIQTSPVKITSPMHPKGRILYVYSGKAKATSAGLDLVVRQQLKALTDAGYQVTFVSRGRYDHPNVRNFSLPLTPANLVSMLPAPYYYNLQHRFFSSLGASVARCSKFDAVIGWQGSSRTLFRSAAALNIPCLLNCPVVCAQKDISQPTAASRALNWPVPDIAYLSDEYNTASVLLTASEQARESFSHAGYNQAKIVNIQRGADLARFQQLPNPEHPFKAVFFGRVCNRKGIFQTLEAWEKAALPNSELWIIGFVDREIERELHLKLPKNARLFGHRNDAENLLPQCHVQILPTAAEGMAKTLVEGAACGCVSIVTKESGFPVIEGKTGFLVERSNTDEMARLLKLLAADRNALKTMRQHASEFVRSHLSWDCFASKFVSAVEQAIKMPHLD